MKTTLSLTLVMVFSAIMLSPKLPKEYPPKKVIHQREEVVLKERVLENLIEKIEYTIIVDSIQIADIKQN